MLPVATADGARYTVKIGPHHGNRVGHVQGGLLLGLAASGARAAAPRHPVLSAIAAWYISPGQGRALRIRSRRVHEGRSFAVVRTEIVRAARTAAAAGEIDEAAIERALDTHDLPPLDLLIRTSGEHRLSNFLLWQAAYAELLFVDTLWPDFNEATLADALAQYGGRQRRFGGL